MPQHAPEDSVPEDRRGSGESAPRITRRSVLTTGLAAGGIGLASGSTVAEAATSTGVALGPTGTTTVEFRAKITQTGPTGAIFKSFGYLTRVTQLTRHDLFEGAGLSESTALFTAFATGDLRTRIHKSTVNSIDIVGVLTVYQRRNPGASYDDPASFKVGREVARFDVTLQDVLAVYAAGQGIPTLTGDMLQKRADTMSGDLSDQQFGRRGTRLRFFATGLGTLLDPATLNSELEIAGNWAIE